MRGIGPKIAMMPNASNESGLPRMMLGERPLDQEIESSRGRIRLDLLIPPRVIVFDEPITKCGERLIIKAFDLAFNCFDVAHGRCLLRLGRDCNAA